TKNPSTSDSGSAKRSASRPVQYIRWKPSPIATFSRSRLRTSTTSYDSRTVTDARERTRHEHRHNLMKVVIPLAGKGTRLRPHTHITPKPMLKIAGKPVIDYVMEDLQRLGNVEQVVYITGHLKEKVEDYARKS